MCPPMNTLLTVSARGNRPMTVINPAMDDGAVALMPRRFDQLNRSTGRPARPPRLQQRRHYPVPISAQRGSNTWSTALAAADSVDMADGMARDHLEQQEDATFSPARSAWIGGHGTEP
jgi:hypothetical protein